MIFFCKVSWCTLRHTYRGRNRSENCKRDLWDNTVMRQRCISLADLLYIVFKVRVAVYLLRVVFVGCIYKQLLSFWTIKLVQILFARTSWKESFSDFMCFHFVKILHLFWAFFVGRVVYSSLVEGKVENFTICMSYVAFVISCLI